MFFTHTHLKYMSWQAPILIDTLLCIFSLKTSNYEKLKFPSKDTANPLSHQVIASSNLFNSTQAMVPVGNNTKKHIITVAQSQAKEPETTEN